MSKLLSCLTAIMILTSIASQVRAESTCGSDTSADPVVAMGKDVWLNGYCKGFLPCRQVLEIFTTCKEAEDFLSRLDAKEGQPLSEDQVADALVVTKGTSTNISACVWNFDAQKCKQYLGVGEGSSENTQQTTLSGSPLTASIEAKKRAMSQSAALDARQRVLNMDSNAHSALGVIERTCRAGGNECKKTLNDLVTPVIRATEEINTSVDHLAHFPPYSPKSVEYANRLGWTKSKEQWLFNNEPNGAVRTTLGPYLLNSDECKKLYSRLDKEIKSKPEEEPVELSFFETECLQQMPDYQASVTRWRQGFGKTTAKLASSSTSKMPLDPKIKNDLSQWDGGLRQAEAARTKARQEEELRIAQQRKREEEKKLSEAVSNLSSPTSPIKNEGKSFASICDRNSAKIQDVVMNSGLKFYSSGYGTYLMNKLTVEREGRCNNLSPTLKGHLERARDNIKMYEQKCGGQITNDSECRYSQDDERFIALLTQESRKSINDPNYSSSYGVVSGNNKSSTPTTGKPSGECLEKERQIKNTNIPSNATVTSSTETVMFITKTNIEMIDAGCPGTDRNSRADLLKAFNSAEQACNAVQSGGRRCSANKHH